MPNKISDIALVTRAAVFGDRKAFDSLVSRHQSAVRRFLLSLTLGDSQLADDLAQEAFIKAYTGISKFRGLSAFPTWLMRIAYNTYLDYSRSAHPTADIDAACMTRLDGGSADCALGIDIMKALATLKPEERSCITLQLIDGQPIQKIACIMGMPESTVKSHLKRGKDKLTTYLKNNGYER